MVNKLVTFDNLKEKYENLLKDIDKIDNVLKPSIISSVVQKINYYEMILKMLKIHYYPDDKYSMRFYNAGNYLATNRIRYELHLLKVYYQNLCGNKCDYNHTGFYTKTIMDKLELIISITND